MLSVHTKMTWPLRDEKKKNTKKHSEASYSHKKAKTYFISVFGVMR